MNNNYYFIRHGQTHWNKNGIMHGQYDIPLNNTGINQAKKISLNLKNEDFNICYSSPLSRARSTAIEILKYHRNTKIIYDDRLKELNKGLLEGKHLNSEKILKDEDYKILKKYAIESKLDFYKRVSEFIDEIESKFKNKKILIVSHSGTIKMCFFKFDYPKIPLHKAYYKLHIKNCQLYQKNKTNNMKVGFFPMVADILHSGHVIAIEEAKKQCDYLIIGLHCKPNYKNPQQSIYERFMQLRAVKWVDEIIPYENIDIDKNVFRSLDYDIYFLGEDHKNEDWELKEDIQNMNKEIVYIKRNHEYSSTRIKNSNK
jgi:glycerol-3-phosphate cytidylyltransferase